MVLMTVNVYGLTRGSAEATGGGSCLPLSHLRPLACGGLLSRVVVDYDLPARTCPPRRGGPRAKRL